ncbi:MFS transporter [Dysgonomonas sp. HDW5B]|uniref:MFS transporter n=1 Tax=Dysgonomonas sp. HDW5B TaxID=2714927 RepID=UPI00140A9082|nr:MFS transporter [Dysgonomonas sp. HDW5B]QIK55051.1 MFS transporter [Dysgonomonas sp. HDW5B]
MANNKKILSIDFKINGDKQLKETVNDLTALDKTIITAKFPTKLAESFRSFSDLSVIFTSTATNGAFFPPPIKPYRI